jgi:hypothetical protein
MEAPPEWNRVTILPGVSGDLYILDGEAPLHRCPTLTVEEATELLKLCGDALGWKGGPPS